MTGFFHIQTVCLWPEFTLWGANGQGQLLEYSHKVTSRDRILSIATKHFARDGYAGTSLEQVVADAGVTRGALYHHFSDKRTLFLLVCHQLQFKTKLAIDAAIEKADNPWQAFVNGVHSLIESASTPEARRILYVERVSVLTWEEWHEIDVQTVAGSMQKVMQDAMDSGYMHRRPIEPLFFIVACAISRITTVAAEYDPVTLEDFHAEFDDMMDRYRIQ